MSDYYNKYGDAFAKEEDFDYYYDLMLYDENDSDSDDYDYYE